MLLKDVEGEELVPTKLLATRIIHLEEGGVKDDTRMFNTLKLRINALIIAGSVLMIIAPALPAYAADDVVVDNGSTQAADSGQAGDPPPPPPADPTPPPEVVNPNPEPLPLTPEPTPPAPDIVPPASDNLTPPVDQPIVTDSANNPDTNAEQTNYSDPLNPSSPPNVTSNTTVENNLDSQAQSGDANVSANNNAGNATTGNADAIATLLNLLQSSLSFDGSSLLTFNKDIFGDQFGDIYIDPRILSTASTIAKKPEDNLNVNSEANALINNNINLGAVTGNAGVNHNGVAGNATSGNATALLNLINIINSLAVSHQSFLGSINIYGNLNGDILLPQELIDALLAATSSNGGATNADINTDQSIVNNINQEANTGTATVKHNGEAGDALTGNALNKLTILNLTNRQIIGKNAMLVIVNVMGNWIGMIVDAPGSNTAVLGGGGSSINDLSDSGVADLNLDSNARIVNNIDLSATSGDASVTGNNKAGNAKTGNATTAINLINIINSQISVSDWFGILFINVFGTWNGSFGVNTAAGNSDEATPPPAAAPFIEFVPAAAPASAKVIKKVIPVAFASDDDTDDLQNVLGLAVDDGLPTIGATTHVNGDMVAIALGGLACFGLLGAVERRRERNKHYQTKQTLYDTTI